MSTPTSKVRSPNYPQISLPEAVERVRAVYNSLHTARANQDQILTMLGYKGRSGTSQGVLSALRKYGLLEGTGDSLRVSNDAVTILERQTDHPERIAALHRAALAPALFAEMYEYFRNQTPNDEDMRVYLVTRGFSRRATDEVIHTYRATVGLVTEADQEYDAGEESEEAQQQPPVGATPMQQTEARAPQTRQMAEVRDAYHLERGDALALLDQIPADESQNFRISDSCKVRLFFDGTVTQEAIRKLIRYLELGMDDFPTKAELELHVPKPQRPEPVPPSQATLEELEEAFKDE